MPRKRNGEPSAVSEPRGSSPRSSAAPPPAFRDRVKELRRVKASELRRHPDNWRLHNDGQRNALVAMIEDIGFATAALAFENANGELQLIDGHLRTDLAADAEIPVLILDVDENEARSLLVSLDPLAAMAGADAEQLARLLDAQPLPIGADELLATLQQIAQNVAETLDAADEEADEKEVNIPETFQVVAACDDEASQRELYERLIADGYACKLLTT
jgi:ParB-like chromosome segregation protein Spo0J